MLILVSIAFGILFLNLEWFFSVIERDFATMICTSVLVSSPIILTCVYDNIFSAKKAVDAWYVAYMTTIVAFINILSYKYGSFAMLLALCLMLLGMIFLLPIIDGGYLKILIILEWLTGLFLAIKYNDDPFWSLLPEQMYSGKHMITVIPVYFSILLAVIIHFKEIKQSKQH